MLTLILPLVAYFVFAVALTWLAALARDRWEARRRHGLNRKAEHIGRK